MDLKLHSTIFSVHNPFPSSHFEQFTQICSSSQASRRWGEDIPIRSKRRRNVYRKDVAVVATVATNWSILDKILHYKFSYNKFSNNISQSVNNTEFQWEKGCIKSNRIFFFHINFFNLSSQSYHTLTFIFN